MAQEQRIVPRDIEEELKSSYLDYAMSVIVARALPDVRDGLKPVQRRILYGMEDLGVRPGTPYKKSARIVGDVLGKYHPHGDVPVYEALVRMAQPFSLRYPLVDGQGNFGSVDNDPPAAMRYTEARLAAIAAEMLADLDRDTVDFLPNFDGSLREPTVLPARLPQLLINGSSGIAVGMATNIPPYNLREICDALVLLIDNPEATAEELLRRVRGPDFPTGGILTRYERRLEPDPEDAEGRKKVTVRHDVLAQVSATGRGRLMVRAKVEIEEASRTGRHQLVVTELPYQVNKAALLARIAELVRDKRLEGIADLRDESDRHGLRVVIELKREAQPRQVLNSLYKFTALQSAFHVNLLALVDGQPRSMGLRTALDHFLDFRRRVLRRRTQYDLRKAQERAHILEGFRLALERIEEVIQTIRNSRTAETARTNLQRSFGLSQIQAQAILDMPLRRLAALERQRLLDELVELLKTIAGLEELLANPRKLDLALKEEISDLRKKYGDDRRTVIVDEEAEELTTEDLTPHEEVVVTLSERGYIKRLPAQLYRSQLRGGRGVTGVVQREDDAVRHLLVADTHDHLLFFTQRGRVFHLRCYELDADTSRQAKGRPLINLVSLEQGELVTAVLALTSFEGERSLVMATRRGEVKRTTLAEFSAVRSNGLIAMDLEPEDELVAVETVKERDEVLLVTEQARAIRFPVSDLRQASRTSGGVRGIALGTGDRLMALDVVRPGVELLSATALGMGKRTPLTEFPIHHRGGGGVLALRLSDRTGPLVVARLVQPEQEIMLISAEGIVIRQSVEGISRQGRASQGVGVMRLDQGDRVVGVAPLLGVEGPAERPSGAGGGARRRSSSERA